MAQKTVKANGVSITVTAWHYELADAFQGQLTAKESALAMVKTRYTKLPTYAQYKADLKALQAVAEEKARDYVWLRRCYSGALMELFQALPESNDPEAKRKREERKAKKLEAKQVLIDAGLTKAPKDWQAVEVTATPAKKSNAGAPAGEVKDQKVSFSEQLEQFIARHDVFEVLDAVARILADDKSTELEAAGLTSIANKLRLTLKPREVARAEPVKKARKPRATQNNKPQQQAA